jgi:hypothetical protein
MEQWHMDSADFIWWESTLHRGCNLPNVHRRQYCEKECLLKRNRGEIHKGLNTETAFVDLQFLSSKKAIFIARTHLPDITSSRFLLFGFLSFKIQQVC